MVIRWRCQCITGITDLGRATLRLPERSQSGGDGLTANLTHPLSLKGDANTARVAVRPGYPNLVQSSCHRWLQGGTVPPSMRYPRLHSTLLLTSTGNG